MTWPDLRYTPSQVEAILDGGGTLPAELYTSAAVAALEERWIWAGAWAPAGIVHELRLSGGFVTGTLGSASVCAVRGDDGPVSAVVNACPRCGRRLVGDVGRVDELSCPHDGLRWDLAGRPTRGRERLAAAAVDVHAGVVYVSVDPRESLAAFLGEAPAIERSMGLATPLTLHDDWVRVPGRRSPVRFRSNWKVAVENATECYHCPGVHAGTFAACFDVDPEAYVVGVFDRGVYQLANRVGERCRPELGDADLQFVFLHPNGPGTGAGSSGDAELWLGTGIRPLGVHESVVLEGITYRRAGTACAAPSAEARRMERMIALSAQEDAEICAAVQVGLRSGMVPIGRTVPDAEPNIRHFQRLWWEALAPAWSS